MKSFFRIIKEYPLSALICTVIDIAVTVYNAELSIAASEFAAVYLEVLYGSMLGVLIFSAGYVCALRRAQRKLAEDRRMARRREMAAIYRKQYYEECCK